MEYPRMVKSIPSMSFMLSSTCTKNSFTFLSSASIFSFLSPTSLERPACLLYLTLKRPAVVPENTIFPFGLLLLQSLFCRSSVDCADAAESDMISASSALALLLQRGSFCITWDRACFLGFGSSPFLGTAFDTAAEDPPRLGNFVCVHIFRLAQSSALEICPLYAFNSFFGPLLSHVRHFLGGFDALMTFDHCKLTLGPKGTCEAPGIGNKNKSHREFDTRIFKYAFVPPLLPPQWTP